MKKNNLYIGLLYMALGAVCLWFALKIDNSVSSLLFGFSGAGLIGGLSLIFKYFYWSSSKRKDAYEARLEKEQINLRDEFKESLRNRPGRIAYIITLLVITVSIVIFSIISSLGKLDTKLLVIYLGVLWTFFNPRVIAKWVLPVPGGPIKATFSLLRTNSQVVRLYINLLLIVGLADN